MSAQKQRPSGRGNRSGQGKTFNSRDYSRDAPIVTGQCAEVLALIRERQPVLSFVLTADHAIPEAAARVHDLRNLGFNIQTRIVPEIVFRGRVRKNAALYSLGSPEWLNPDRERGRS
ncbi:hypothetical protein FACS189475_04620 [Betaproteobacteria bacterium]|nr:hypothetical protein FACS189475_04620 [Betaproteobacteria bacterium]